MGGEKSAIGIDLGTTNSVVAVYKNGKVTIIHNEEGLCTTPSCVAYTEEGERLIGQLAKAQITDNPKNTILDIKRMMGRPYDDPKLQEDLKRFPFKVTSDLDGRPVVHAKQGKRRMKLYPEALSGFILGKMKDIAEAYLGHPVKKAVVTVPAYFNDSQRRATRDAGKAAGLEVERIINEPTAAAIAYGLDKKDEEKKIVLVVDCGGGTHDLTILEIEGGSFNVKATAGDTHLGGEDFDNKLVDHFAAIFKKKYKTSIKKNKKAMARLKKECELVKKYLSSAQKTKLTIDCFYKGNDFKESITRDEFNEMVMDLVEKMVKPIKKLLKRAGVKKKNVDEIVLVGGSTRIPLVRQKLEEYFGGKQLNRSLNPDEAVAYGAAVQAAILNNDKSEEIEDVVLLDVTPLSLGLETAGGVMTALIPRDSVLPYDASQVFSTYSDNQSGVYIKVYEGERSRTDDDNLLGTFHLDGIPPAPQGEPRIEVKFSIDENSILDVSAKDLNTGNHDSITIENERGRLSKTQIDKMIKDAVKYKKEDELFARKADVENELHNMAASIKRDLRDKFFSKHIAREDREELAKKAAEIERWIESDEDRSLDELMKKRTDLKNFYTPVRTQAVSLSSNTSGRPLFGGMGNQFEKGMYGSSSEDEDDNSEKSDDSDSSEEPPASSFRGLNFRNFTKANFDFFKTDDDEDDSDEEVEVEEEEDENDDENDEDEDEEEGEDNEKEEGEEGEEDDDEEEYESDSD